MPQESGGKWKRSKKKRGIKKLSKSVINLVLKNNTVIRILAIELLNTILLLIFLMIKSLFKKIDVVP
jgi:hypothetical protein